MTSTVATITGTDRAAYVSFADGVEVHLYTLLGCEALGCADAYIRDGGDYSTITYIDGNRYGKIGTERLPRDLEALPAYSTERSEAVRAYQASNHATAAAYIAAARAALEEGK